MRIALLGYGKEGQAAEKYFKSHFKDAVIDVLGDVPIVIDKFHIIKELNK